MVFIVPPQVGLKNSTVVCVFNYSFFQIKCQYNTYKTNISQYIHCIHIYIYIYIRTENKLSTKDNLLFYQLPKKLNKIIDMQI